MLKDRNRVLSDKPIPLCSTKGGRASVKSMFKEFAEKPEEAPYSLLEWHRRFLELRDLTEIKAALEFVGSLEVWNLMKRDWPYFARQIEAWKVELNELLKADAFQKILDLQNCEAKSVALSASKYIANSEFLKRGSAGRPKKSEARKREEEIIKQRLDTNDDWERIQQLVVVK